MGMPTVLVPRNAGVLSAFGLLVSDPVKDYSKSLMRTDAQISLPRIDSEFRALEERARWDMAEDGFAQANIVLERSLESLERLRAQRGEAPALALVVPALYRKTQLADEILAKLRERFPDRLSRTVLGWSVKVDEAQSHGRTIFEHAPRSAGARALAGIADELLALGGAERLAV